VIPDCHYTRKLSKAHINLRHQRASEGNISKTLGAFYLFCDRLHQIDGPRATSRVHKSSKCLQQIVFENKQRRKKRSHILKELYQLYLQTICQVKNISLQ